MTYYSRLGFQLFRARQGCYIFTQISPDSIMRSGWDSSSGIRKLAGAFDQDLGALDDLLDQNIFFGRMKPLSTWAKQNAWDSRLAQESGICPKALCPDPHHGAKDSFGGSHQRPHDARSGRRFQ